MSSIPNQPINPTLTYSPSVSIHPSHTEQIEIAAQSLNLDDVPHLPFIPNTWFESIDVENNSEHATPKKYYIEVQPDVRSPFAYIAHTSALIYDRLHHEIQSAFSLFSLIGYQLIMFNAHILIQDTTHRRLNTPANEPFVRDHLRSDFVAELQRCHIPGSLVKLIQQLAPVKDSTKASLVFLPSYSAMEFDHDFGRLIPPHILLYMHNLFSTMQTNVQSDELKRRFYDQVVLNIDDNSYRITNFIGGFYQGNDNLNHVNTWLSGIIDSIFNPALGRAHQRRPTFQTIHLRTPTVTPDTINPYDILLCYDDDNQQSITQFMKSMSAFIASEPSFKSVPLSVATMKAESMTIINHTLEPATLPTWHKLNRPEVPVTDKTPLVTVAPEKHANTCGFMTDLKLGKDKFTDSQIKFCEKCNIPEQLLLAKKQTGRLDTLPYYVKPFSKHRDVTPDVYLYQPYERNPTTAAGAITLGLKIEFEEFDATSIPLVNFEDTVLRNNSTFMTGSIPITQVRPVIMSNDPKYAFKVLERETFSHQVRAYAQRDAGQVIAPVFDNEDININDNDDWLKGYEIEESHTHPENTYTWTAWRHGTENDIPSQSRYLWSSYRYLEQTKNNGNLTHLYYTLSGLYGSIVPLRRIQNPILKIPRI